MQQRIAASILCVMCISSVILQLQAAVKAATSSYQHTVLQHWSTAGVFKAGSNLDKLHCLQRGTNSAARQEAVLIIPALDSVAWPSKSLKKSLGQELKQ